MSIVINNGTTDLTLTPTGATADGGFRYVNRIDGRPDLSSDLRLKYHMNANNVHKGKVDLTIPLVRTIEGEQESVGKCFANVSFSFPSNATTAERTAMIASVDSALSNEKVLGVIRDLTAQYA